MDSFVPESYELVDRDNALSFWELINASDAADSDSDFEIEIVSLDDGIASLHSSLSASASPNHSANNSLDLAEDHVHADADSAVHETPILGQDLALVNIVYDDAIDDVHGYVCHRSYEEEEGEDEEYDDEDLNDELVPWSVSGKFGRQRMRKLGKRGFAKMGNSKKVPYTHVKPGCLHGKHGLGVKHNC